MNVTKTLAVVALSAVAASGCVSKGTYDDAVAKTATTQAQLDKQTVSLGQSLAEIEKQRSEIARLEALLGDVSKSSDKDRAWNETRVADLRKRIDDLRAAQYAAESRAALYKDLTLRLKQQIDDGDLFIVVRDGRMVLQLPNDVLFDTGKTEIKPAGKKALAAVAEVMKIMSHRQFQIAGHTDNVPIHNERFPSNWELSSGRALGVVHFLIEKGVDPAVLSAAGYGEIDPVSPNADPVGRKKNRRTEITLQPQIDELVKVPTP